MAVSGGRRQEGAAPPDTDEPPGWLDEIDATPGPPFLRMGTRTLTGGWLLGGPDVADQLTEKRRVLVLHHDETVAALPGTEHAAAELLALVEHHLALVGPVDGITLAPLPADRDAMHPVEVAARQVAEDLCVLVRHSGPDGDRWVLGAACVCFPSHWRLADKLGRPVAEIHAPVPHYGDELGTRVDRFLDRLRARTGAWRRNWMVHTHAELYAPTPPPPPDPPVTVADAGRRLCLRSERQTLRALPRSGAIVFGIRTQQVQLADLAGRPALAARLAASAEAWSPELVAYRGGEAVRQPLVAWLRAHAGERAAG